MTPTLLGHDGRPRPSQGRRRWVWPACWLGAGALLAFTLGRAGVRDVGIALGGAHPGWLVLALLANLLILFLWASAWKVMLPRDTSIRFGRMWEIVAVTAFSQNTMPLLLGHASSAVALSRHGGARGAAVLSVLATQEVTEGVAKVTVLLLAASLAPLPSWMRAGAGAIALAAGAFALLLVGISRFRGGEAPAMPETGKAGLAHRLWMAVGAFSLRLEVLRDGRRYLLVQTLLCSMKGAEAVGILCAQKALGIDLPLSSLPGALGAVMLASLVPFAPANLGTYEAGAFFLYRQLGVEAGAAMALALVQHLALLVPFLGAGFWVLTVRLARPGAGDEEGTGDLPVPHRAEA